MNTNNNAEVLHLTEPMVLDLIKKVEESIHHIAEKMESKRQNLKEAEELYLPLKQEWDMFQEALNKEKVLLQTLVGFKENTNLRKNVKVHRSISNSKERKPKSTYLPITSTAVSILQIEQQFLRPDNLVNKMYEANPEWQKLVPDITVHKKKTRDNLRNIAQRPDGQTKKVIVWNGKFGLPDWLDEEGVPKAKFLNSLIHA